MTIYIYYYFMTTRSPPPRFLNSASLSRPRFRSTATSPANSPSKTSKLSATLVLSDMVSRVQSVLSVFSPRKSSKRSRRWERVNTASTPSWTTGASPNTGRFFASNIAADLFPSSFFSSKLLLLSSRVVVCFLFFEMMVEVAFIFVFFSFVRLFVCAQQVDISHG